MCSEHVNSEINICRTWNKDYCDYNNYVIIVWKDKREEVLGFRKWTSEAFNSS